MFSQSRSRRIARLALVVLVPGLCLVLLEISLRFFHYGHETDFLIRRATDSGEFWVDNPRFSDRFFPRSMERRSVPVFVSVAKPRDAYRVVVLGSSAAMGDPDPIFGFSRILDVMLSDSHRDSKVEVINTGMVAINSHVVREIARELVKLSPDAVIVYVGNNEVVGPFGPSSLQGNTPPPLPIIRARIALGRTRVGQLLERSVAFLMRKQEPGVWRGMKLFLGRGMDEDDARLDAVYDNYSANMEAILAAVRRTGARCVIVQPPVNLRACAPFEGVEADAVYQAGVRLWKKGLHSEARTLFLRAADRDRLRFRADSTIRKHALEKARGSVAVVSTRDLEDSGHDIFLDHVHLNFAGNYLLARATGASMISSESATVAIPTESECARRLGYSRWDRYRILGEMRLRMSLPPFTNQSGHALDMAWLDGELRRARPESSPLAAAAMIATYESAVHKRPADPQLRWAFARCLDEIGRPDRAAQELRRAIELWPFATGIRHDLAVALAKSGLWENAELEIRQALEIAPSNSTLRYLLADALYRRGRAQEAIAEFRRDIDENPGLVESRNTLAWILATGAVGSAGDRAEAVRLAEEALRLSGDDHPKILDTLAAACAATGNYSRASQIQKNAVEIMMRREGNVPDDVLRRLDLYQRGQPYRE